MTQLLVFTLATLGGWDILRRMLPMRLPVAAGEVVCFVTAYTLITRAPGSIVQSLAVIGGIMIIATFARTEPVTPWGGLVMQLYRDVQSRQRKTRPVRDTERIGHRLPKL